jgi:uncharacterized protein
MKLDAALPRKGNGGDNAFRPAARGERAPAPQAGGQSAMAAAFAKLKAKA